MFERQDLNQIMDAVKQGIVASKDSDSRFWGDFNEWRKKKDARDEVIHDTLLRLTASFENMAEANRIRNGRIEKLEANSKTLEETRVASLGGFKAFMILIPIVMALISSVFWLRTDSIEANVASASFELTKLKDLHISKIQ